MNNVTGFVYHYFVQAMLLSTKQPISKMRDSGIREYRFVFFVLGMYPFRLNTSKNMNVSVS